MSEQLYLPSTGLRPHGKTQSDHFLAKPSFVVSCSAFGPKVCLSWIRYHCHKDAAVVLPLSIISMIFVLLNLRSFLI